RSGDVESRRADPRRADDHYRDRAVFLDVLDADAVGRLDVRPVHRRALQQRPAELRSGGRLAGHGRRRARAVLATAEPGAVRREITGRSRGSGAAWLHGNGGSVCRVVHRRAARRLHGRVLAARFQMKIVAALLLIATLLAAAISVQAARERAYPVPVVDDDALAITSGPVARRLSLAYTGLAADVYWIRAIQYYGRTKSR